nr:DUF4166 domain-containing protein [Allosalinactinospora lopnorensis]
MARQLLRRAFPRSGGSRNILVPKAGRDVPFTIENVPYRDSYGRETVTFVRTFAFPDRSRRFDATMVFSPERGCIVDYLGTHQHLASDPHAGVDDEGAIIIRSGRQRFREGIIDVRVPELLSGSATVRESYDDRTGRFRVQVSVGNRRFGPLFGYHGSFTAEYVALAGALRPGLRPAREESRV